MRRKITRRPHDDARVLLDTLAPYDGRTPRTPAAALVVLAGRLDSPVQATAAWVGVQVEELRGLLSEWRLVPADVLERLQAGVAALWAAWCRLGGKARAELLAAVWASPVPLTASLRAPTPLSGVAGPRRHASRKFSPRILERSSRR